MRTDLYHVINETNEDRFGEAETLEEALRAARAVACEMPTGEPVSVEYRGKVIRQLVLLPDGEVKVEAIS